MIDAQAPSGTPTGLAEILLTLQEESPVLVALFDEHDVLRHANRAYREAYKVRPEDGVSWADMMRLSHSRREGALIESDDIEGWLAGVTSRRGKLPFRAFEADLCDGRWLWMTETIHANGWMFCVANDITNLRQDSRSLRQAHAKALAAAQTDGLTGLSNRRHGMQLLQAALAHTESWPLCVASLDLDHFKDINDSLGHGAGDRVIIDFARQLQGAIRREDGCARIGGEEFLLILPAAGASEAGAVLARLLARVREARPLAEQPQRGYTCSAGLAQAVWGETAEALLCRADAALYRAKETGRDRIEKADD